MHPIDKKNRILAGVIIGIAIVISIISIIISPFNVIFILIFSLLTLIDHQNIKHIIALLAIFIVTTFPVLFVMEHFLLENYNSNTTTDGTTTILLGSLFVFAVIVAFDYMYFNHVITAMKNEKKHYDLINNYPYLICRKHNTRTVPYSTMGYKGINCRMDGKCLRNSDIIKSVNLVGLIGKIEDGKIINNDYFVSVWDHRRRKIRYGDYDTIEIHKNKEIKDYDFVISKIITFFFNEINRQKPIHEVSVRVIGNPSISENTKRLLQKYFLNVEYLSD